MVNKLKNLILLGTMVVGSICAIGSLNSCSPTAEQIEKMNLPVGDIIDLYQIAFQKGIDVGKATYKSSKPKVAIASSNGVITALAEGVTTASVLIDDKEVYSYQINVTTYEELEAKSVSLKDTGYSFSNSIQSIFTDINVGRCLAKNSMYEIAPSFGGCTNNSQLFSVSFSNPDVCSYYFDDVLNKHYIETGSVGNTIMEITNADGVIVYRIVIKVRAPHVGDADLQDHLFSIDKFDNWGFLDANTVVKGGCQISFLSPNNAVFKGTDGGTDLGSIFFTFELDETYPSDDDGFFYNVSFENNKSDLRITYMKIFNTADEILVYNNATSDGFLLDIFVPVEK